MKDVAQIVIYTDLDGTFLDHRTYSCAESLPALRAAKAKDIPVVFCSSKTRAEIEVIRQYTLVRDPFIVENGGAIFVPEDYFPFPLEGSISRDGFAVIELGTPYAKLIQTFRRLQEGVPGRLRGFSDMTDEELAADGGLTLAEARRAKQREYDEAFKIFNAGPAVIQLIRRKIKEAGLRLTVGGRYYHVLGDNDKGRAVSLLNDLFRKTYGAIFTVGLGDSLNDLPMLHVVDLPVLVQKPEGHYDPVVTAALPQVRLAKDVGPQGWRRAVTDILAETTMT